MKRIVVLCAALLSPLIAHAALSVPGANDSDGALLVTANTQIDLSQAVTGVWDADNSANAGKGIYDASKWAVVFKYSSVTIDAGATLTFANHRSRAPVVWIVSGDVTINGTISLDGSNGVAAPQLANPGPGGFRGGQGQLLQASTDAGSGFGPGGGYTGNTGGTPTTNGNIGFAGSYGTTGAWGAPTYGNPSLLPLLGGAGGGGDADNAGGGGAGGGAILVISENTITLAGTIRSNGGNGLNDAGGGSGGGIRLVSATLSGTGTLAANGGSGWGGGAGAGRIRIERVTNSNTINVAPSPSVIQLTDGSSPLVWPPSTAPQVKVVSIGGQAAPDDPLASFGTYGPDVAVADTTTTPIVIQTTNVEQASQVKVRVTPRTNANYSEVTATVSEVVSTDPLVINWTANLPVSAGYAAVQVRVIRP